uniref:protein disulfide-isomerase n=1 Tax=Lates calcarifer TaxID=8187 RepID=A0A4W6CLW1_LATCA
CLLLLSVLLCVALVSGVYCVLLCDVVVLQFYAPWCTFCKQLDPVWHQIGSELKSLGSPVNVGKSDATTNTGLAKEFRVRGYPAILMLKKGVKYNYSGPRTKDGIMDFAHRVGGPLIRSLSSLQLFQHAMNRHDVMFVYVGATSQLKGNYASAAEELIVHTYFFSATRDVLPKVTFLMNDFPYVSEESDGELKSWINRERFPMYFKIDSYTLYAMGESGNINTPQSDVNTHRNFYFGFMEGSDYINGLVMGEVIVPSLIVINLSNDGYFLPPGAVETERHLLDFLNGVLDGSVQCHGGNSATQRIRRFIYDAKVTLTPVFSQAPLLGCFLVGFPFTILAIFCYLCCKARSNVSDDDTDNVVLLASSQQHRKKTTNKKSD